MTPCTGRGAPLEVPADMAPSCATGGATGGNSPPLLLVRSAQADDARRISDLVNAHAAAGLTLPRSIENVQACLGEFVVAERAGVVIACGALNAISPSLAEIRSIASAPEAQGTGAGRGVVEFLIDLAFVLEIDELVLLTKIPAFFAKFGFRVIEPQQAPRVFLDEAIAGRGRTIAGRTIMYRAVSPGVS